MLKVLVGAVAFVWCVLGVEIQGRTCAQCGTNRADRTFLLGPLRLLTLTGAERTYSTGLSRAAYEAITGASHAEHAWQLCGVHAVSQYGALAEGGGDDRVLRRVFAAKAAAESTKDSGERRRRFLIVLGCPLTDGGAEWDEVNGIVDREAWGELSRMSWAAGVVAVGSATVTDRR